ncbi:uncharacterized protein UTRI_02356 [Ustilago trichophora]|uniref:Uncharacterized protein n=1 Tax=Ustilago trichophora TaxID=86804 RepID=A0A5C3E6D4_9BASI|nr:uncharacterized protein UTRI_02356 [Ustilago trichophora]
MVGNKFEIRSPEGNALPLVLEPQKLIALTEALPHENRPFAVLTLWHMAKTAEAYRNGSTPTLYRSLSAIQEKERKMRGPLLRLRIALKSYFGRWVHIVYPCEPRERGVMLVLTPNFSFQE